MTINESQVELQKEPMIDYNNNGQEVVKSEIKNNLFSRYFTLTSQLAREFLAEMFGTFLLVIFINGSVAQNTFNNRDDPRLNNPFGINITCGLAVTMAILVVGKVSGAHINPAVSFSMLMLRKMSALRFLVYVVAQILGAFLGAFAVYLVYFDMINSFEPDCTLNTASIFATYPNAKLTLAGALFDQCFSTSLLVIFVLAVTDKKNEDMSHGAVAVFVGFAVMMIGTSFGYNCGYAINPARDFGPRLFTFVAGWGTQVFTTGNYFFIIPIVGPMLGSVFGTLIYHALISNHFPKSQKNGIRL